MNQRSIYYLFVFIVFLMFGSLACLSGVVPAPTQTAQPANDSSSSLKTFTDQNNLYQIAIPANWTHDQKTGENYYLDILLSPDEAVKVETIVYNDGKPFTGSQNGKFALDLLNKFYSETGNVGDIKVTDDAMMDNGSERLTWSSHAGGYSGISFFEIRSSDHTTFLMFTVFWLDSVKGQYQDIVNNIIGSYRVR